MVFSSWRADVNRSGGLATQMGVNIFDTLLYLFGGVKDKVINREEPDCVCGILFLEHAKIRWFFPSIQNTWEWLKKKFIIK